MRFLFDDTSFSYQALRTAGYAVEDGADLAEVLIAARSIPDGDEDAWHREWKALGERLLRVADAERSTGHAVSARETYLRASNYLRTADFYRRDHPATDPEVDALGRSMRDAFAAATELFETPVTAVRIPYADTTLPGYLFEVAPGGGPRRTLVYHGGYDSVLEEGYLVVAAAATRRGWNCLMFDGPGMGSVLREQHRYFLPEWERVVSAVVDFASGRPEVDPDRIVLMGTSFGGYLAARAAALEPRLAAVVLHCAIYDAHRAAWHGLPKEVLDAADAGDDDAVAAALERPMSTSTATRWFLKNGVWAFGARSYGDLIRKTESYTLSGLAERIRCPVLLLEAENDTGFLGEAQSVIDELHVPYEHLVLTDAEGAGEHCHEGAMRTFQRVAFDWMDRTLA